jgi:phospholipid/cholesterol/gamma-HCH transport system substrate-binding protein
MNEFRKNLMVGVFVLTGLVALGAMILLFGMAPNALTPTYLITIHFPSTGPVQSDDPVYMNGIQVGQVHEIELRPDIREGINIICAINARYLIPIDAQPIIRKQTIALGKPAISIEVGPKNSGTMLTTDGTAVLHGDVLGGIQELIPKETMHDIENAGKSLTRLAQALEPVAHDLHELLKPKSVEAIDTTTGPDRPLANISTVVQRFDSSLKNFNRIMGDPENRQNVAVLVKNFRIVSERGLELSDRLVGLADKLTTLTSETSDQITTLARALTTDADKLSRVLDHFITAGEMLNSSNGTAGKFLNDPELYESLTLTARRLEASIKDLHALLIQWQEKGIKIEGGILGK